MPDDLLLWNVNSASPMTVEELGSERVRALKVDLVIIDPISAFWPGVEEKNDVATTAIQSFREISRDGDPCLYTSTTRRRKGTMCSNGGSLERSR